MDKGIILNIDHIGLTVSKLSRLGQDLTLAGYNSTHAWTHRPKGKDRFFFQSQSQETVNFFTKEGAFAVELVAVDHPLDRDERPIYFLSDRNGVGEDLASDIGKTFGFNEIVIESEEVGHLSDFLKSVGFKLVQPVGDLVSWRFKPSFSSTEYVLHLRKTPSSGQYFLDSLGINCLAFVVYGIDEFHASLTNEARFVGDIVELAVNEHKLRLFFARVADHIFEFIEFSI